MKALSFMGLKACNRHWNTVGLSCLMLGLSDSALSQVRQEVALWREWMSELQREPSQADKARIYVTTEREIIQTGPSSAQFQNGRYSFILADGTVPDTDGDLDGYTDMFELNEGTDWDDPASFPVDDDGNPLPPDAHLLPTLLLGNGGLMRIANSTTLSNSGVQIDPKRGDNIVRMVSAPPSTMQRGKYLKDFSGEFYFIDPDTGFTARFPLPLYNAGKDFPNPQDVGAFESEMVPGSYQIEFPTLENRPFGRGAVSVQHDQVPNGTFTKGLKKPNWLIRSLKNDERMGAPPVTRSWVDGRLKFDPYQPVQLTWDSIALFGTQLDFIDLFVLDESGFPVSNFFRMGANESGWLFDISSFMRLFFGDATNLTGNPPLSFNGEIVMRYSRIARGRAAADLSAVTVRVPVHMEMSYASWRLAWFPEDFMNNAVSGPNADPDGDGLTNHQEYLRGSNPIVSTINVLNPFSNNVTANSATLGATVALDPFSGVDVTVFERGIIYSASSTNPFPLIDGPGVNRVPAPPAGPGTYTVDVGGLAENTRYSYRGYVITNQGTFHTSTIPTFTTPAIPPVTLPSVTSPASSSVSGTTATLGGTITNNGGSNISQTGVVYSVTTNNDNPFIDGQGVTQINGAGVNSGSFTVNATELQPSTTYSFRAFATNGVGTSHTSEIGTFTTAASPTITSPTATNITSSSATLGGNVTSGGGLAVLQRGIVFSPTNTTPTIGGENTIAFAASTTGLGVFTVSATGLAPATLYHYRAYAINAVGTSYTTVGTFTTTGAVPTLANPTIANLTSTSVTLGASVTSDGQSTILERGFVYSPTAVNNNPVDGGPGVIKFPVAGTTGDYTANITGLTPNTGYTFKAFARNAPGTAYAAPFAFFTTFPPLTVTTPTVTDITSRSATLGGTVQSDGATTVTARGVVFSTDPAVAPVIDGPGVKSVVGTGSMWPFTVEVTGLDPDTHDFFLDPDTDYFFRPFATNNAGTSYSEVSLFRTLPMELLGLSMFEWLEPAEEAGEMLLLAAESSPEDDTRRTRGLRSSTVDANSSPDSGSQVARSPRGIRTADGVSAVETTTGGGNSGRGPFIPRFVYRKHESELSEPITYQIESSADSMAWQTVDESLWDVQHTPETLEATWISSEPPPSRIFFRVKGILD